MNREIFIELRKLLADLYPTTSSIRRILDDAEIQQSRINFSAAVIDIWHSVLTEAEKLGRITELLKIVNGEYGTNEEFRQIYTLYTKARVEPVPVHHKGQFQKLYDAAHNAGFGWWRLTIILSIPILVTILIIIWLDAQRVKELAGIGYVATLPGTVAISTPETQDPLATVQLNTPTPTMLSPVIPTPIPTFTLTPTPTSVFSLFLQNSPDTWIGHGEQVTYTISYRNNGNMPLSNLKVTNVVPMGAELVEDSITTSRGDFTIVTSPSGKIIDWQIGEVDSDGSGKVAYRVQRMPPLPPVIPLAIEPNITAPTIATANQIITYTLTVVNRAPVTLTSIHITNTIPGGAIYMSGGDEVTTGGIIQWILPMLAADSKAVVQYKVIARTSLVNYDYRVTTKEGATARGKAVAITIVDKQAVRSGDGFTLKNTGATATWALSNYSVSSNSVSNPTYKIYLPTFQY